MSLNFMYNIFPIMFFIVFIIVIGTFIMTALKGIGEWNKNNNSPRLTVAASVVAKRQNVSYSHHGKVNNMSGVNGYHTSYYVTFQVQSGDRMEFAVSGSQYGMLVEGDYGQLSFQGSRYLGFIRELC